MMNVRGKIYVSYHFFLKKKVKLKLICQENLEIIIFNQINQNILIKLIYKKNYKNLYIHIQKYKIYCNKLIAIYYMHIICAILPIIIQSSQT